MASAPAAWPQSDFDPATHGASDCSEAPATSLIAATALGRLGETDAHSTARVGGARLRAIPERCPGAVYARITFRHATFPRLQVIAVLRDRQWRFRHSEALPIAHHPMPLARRGDHRLDFVASVPMVFANAGAVALSAFAALKDSVR